MMRVLVNPGRWLRCRRVLSRNERGPLGAADIYSAEYERNGFQGGLQFYRVYTSGRFNGELEAYAGRTIDVPSTFIAGKSDWGIYQAPGALGRMQQTGVHRHEGHPSDRRCRPLGPAGEIGRGEPPARRVLGIDLINAHGRRDRRSRSARLGLVQRRRLQALSEE